MQVLNGPRAKVVRDYNSICRSVISSAADTLCIRSGRLGILKFVEGFNFYEGPARLMPQVFSFSTVELPENKGNDQDLNDVADTENEEDSDEGHARGRRRRPQIWYPEVVEFPNFAAKEEEKFFHELFAFPWQRGRTDRMLRRLEKKYFPKHGLDSFLKKGHVKRSTGNIVVSAQSPSEERPAERFDYPRLAKALSSGMECQQTFRTQRSKPASAQSSLESSGIQFPGYSNEPQIDDYHIPSIRTIRAPLGSERSTSQSDNSSDEETAELLGPSKDTEALKTVDPNASRALTGLKTVTDASKTELKDDIIDIQGGYRSGTEKTPGTSPSKIVTKPLVLKRYMTVPEKWDGPQGTVVLIDKPKGWSSFAVCEKIRTLVRVQKVGHAGTLDPLATGLLVVCVGRATKLADSYQGLPKVYTGTLCLGESTPSGDSGSQVNERKPWEHLTDDDIQRAKETFAGDILQIPPMFSAIKVQGEWLYEKARRGEELNIPARKISIYEFELERSKENRQNLHFRVSCSKGTYIRSLCADFGRALNSCAYMMELRRQKIGAFSVKEAWDYSDLADEYSDQFH